MADVDETQKQEEPEVVSKEEVSTKDSGAPSGPASGGKLRWVVMVVVVVVCAGAGLGLGRLLASPASSKTAGPSHQDQPVPAENVEADDPSTDLQKGWYYPLEPVIACLDEPRATRYVRLTLMLKMSSELSMKEGNVLFEEKMPVLINWLSIYLAGLKIDDIRGDRNQRRMQLQ
ncbi:MAG: flagellar basal body-associated FliL family protein, partial [Planctomycetota bacterium]